MGAHEVARWLKVTRLTPGRRLFALGRTAERAEQMEVEPALRAAIAEAITAHREVMQLVLDWEIARGRTALHQPEARALDAQLDRALAALHRMAAAQRRAFGPDDPAGRLAAMLCEVLFPEGVAAITTLPYTHQYVATERLLQRVRTEEELARAVELLGLQKLIERIEQLAAAYKEALPRRDSVTHPDVEEADDRAFALFTVVVARIIGAFPTDAPEDASARSELLAPLDAQERELLALRRRRRADNRAARQQKAQREPPTTAETLDRGDE